MKYVCLTLLVLSASSPAVAVSQDTLDAIATAEVEQKIPHGLLRALCMSESSLNPGAINKYDGGSASYGLCQIKVSTLHIKGIFGTVSYTSRDLMNPWINAYLSSKYLKHQLKRYNGSVRKALSAYKSGHYTPKNKKYVDRVVNYEKKSTKKGA